MCYACVQSLWMCMYIAQAYMRICIFSYISKHLSKHECVEEFAYEHNCWSKCAHVHACKRCRCVQVRILIRIYTSVRECILRHIYSKFLVKTYNFKKLPVIMVKYKFFLFTQVNLQPSALKFPKQSSAT